MTMTRPRPSTRGNNVWQKDSFQHHRELRADLGLLVGRENVHDAVNRRNRRVGVQSGEGQVPRFCNPERRLDRLKVAHFSDQDHVRIFTKGCAE